MVLIIDKSLDAVIFLGEAPGLLCFTQDPFFINKWIIKKMSSDVPYWSDTFTTTKPS